MKKILLAFVFAAAVMDVVTAAAIFRRAQQMGVGKHL